MSASTNKTFEWQGSIAGLRYGLLLVSFQRFVRPQANVIDSAPASLGCLPVAGTPTGFVLPVADEEAFWVGVELPAATSLNPFILDALRVNGQWISVTKFDRPQTSVIPGMSRADEKYDAFSRRLLVEFRACVGDQCASIHLASPESFSSRTGQLAPGPLDPSAGYQGWRLP